jgi:predicted secreted Zn-dependent protease
MSSYIRGELDWLVSRSCESGACVKVTRRGDLILIGNTSDPSGPVNIFTVEEWMHFLDGAKRGDFDNIA